MESSGVAFISKTHVHRVAARIAVYHDMGICREAALYALLEHVT